MKCYDTKSLQFVTTSSKAIYLKYVDDINKYLIQLQVKYAFSLQFQAIIVVKIEETLISQIVK